MKNRVLVKQGSLRIAIGSDEKTPLTDFVVDELRKRGHRLSLFGPLEGEPMGWPDVGEKVALEVSQKRADQAVVFCLFAQELSGNLATSSDPYELLRSIDRVRGKSLVLISVSGKTRTNLKLARKAKRIARERIAITADASSPLAEVCDRVVLLDYRKSEVLTSGTASFTCGLLACSALLGKLPASLDLSTTYRRSLQWARNVSLSDRGSVMFVGSGVHYAMGFYGEAKIQEVLGTKAQVDYPEQMGHAHLFSIDKKRDTIICIYSGRDKTWELGKVLGRDGFKVVGLNVQGSNPVNNCVRIAVYLQHLALSQAKRKRMRDCAFKADEKRLALSSQLIF